MSKILIWEPVDVVKKKTVQDDAGIWNTTAHKNKEKFVILQANKTSALYARYIKRLADIILSVIAFPFLLVAIVILFPVIWCSDRGPIFYNSPRLGYKGKTFTMYKFRTMKVNAPDIRLADGSTYNGDDDPRQTKIGKFLRKSSLDELPQILNVLKGDMSFVGPRPDLPEHIKLYEKKETDKLSVKPGITGFNQAYYRNTIEWKERLKNDVHYAHNVSLAFDAAILFRTVAMVLLQRNVYVTMDAGAKRNEESR